jgi:hypothetical protein
MKDRWLSVDEIAEFIGIPHDTASKGKAYAGA